ncbi:MAG: metal ABC transporter permease [Sulfuricella sp.]|nr:metal ABC transporter permease [Sulfuricella sp.]
MNLAALDFSIIAPAFAAGLLVTATHVPLGFQVLQRGIVFIDLAVAQIAALGVLAAHLFGWEPQGWAMQALALGAALCGALLLTWTEKRWSDIQEAVIGVLFVLAASGAVLLVSGNPHGGEHLQDLLAGQILWVSPSRLPFDALIYGALIGAWSGLGEKLGRMGFYALFAVAVTVSVQLVGLYLVFATLVIPAIATRRLVGKRRLFAGYALGAASYAVGLTVSALFDLPAGALIVWILALLGVGVLAYASAP